MYIIKTVNQDASNYSLLLSKHQAKHSFGALQSIMMMEKSFDLHVKYNLHGGL